MGSFCPLELEDTAPQTCLNQARDCGDKSLERWDVFLTRKTVIVNLSSVVTCGKQLILGDSLPVTMHDFCPEQPSLLRRFISSLSEDKLICHTPSSLGAVEALAPEGKHTEGLISVTLPWEVWRRDAERILTRDNTCTELTSAKYPSKCRIIITPIWARHCYYYHFRDGKTEA